jgi:PPOX class probable F420-dependent enzyme
VTTSALDLLEPHKYVRLTTFRRDGTPVPTPVWQVRDGDRLLVITNAATGKAKRLRHTPRAMLAPCDQRGRVEPGTQDVAAKVELITDPAEVDRLIGLLKGKYGLMYTVISWMNRLRGQPSNDRVELRISLPG